MKIFGKSYRTIWFESNICFMIDQNKLPFEFEIFKSDNYLDTVEAIRNMTTRGAGAIGSAGAFAMAQAAINSTEHNYLQEIKHAKLIIEQSRPTAQNLFDATNRVYQKAIISPQNAIDEAQLIANENSNDGENIGIFGAELLKDGFSVLTHCNAGWLAFVDWGTALSPIYKATLQGKKIFVYADETRPRLQGGRLTAYELEHQGIEHSIIPDNASAYFMSKGDIDIVIVGADRIAINGDTANKIGTLEKAIIAKEYGIPFYIAAPTSTFDKKAKTGADIPIELRNEEEVRYIKGISKGKIIEVMALNENSNCLNPAFDVTPAKYITGIITEKGIIEATENSITKFLDC